MAGQIQAVCFPDLYNIELIQAAKVTHHTSRHVHEGLCIGMIERGARECQTNGAKEIAHAGQIITINPGEVHACGAAEGIPYSYQILCLDRLCVRSLLQQFAKEEQEVYFKDSIIDDPVCFSSIVRLCNVLLKPVSQLEKQTLLVEMFALFILRHAAGTRQLSRGGKEHFVVRQVQDYVEAHCTEEVSLEELSALFSFSPYYLHRVFSAQVGMPLHAYQIQQRINKAREFLRQGKSFAQAAAETGFVDQSHFLRRFKEIVGLTPGQWLKARGAK